MVKRFSTVRYTQRGLQSYTEKRRGRREIEVTGRRRGGVKRGESKLASNHLLMHAPQSGLLKMLHREEKKEEGDRGDQKKKRGNQKGREQSSQ